MMSQRALDLFFRHKFLILLPMVVLVAIGVVGAVMNQPEPVYRASATIWVQPSALLSSGLVGDDNPYLTSAQNRAQEMQDLLTLDSFALSAGSKVEALADSSPSEKVDAVRDGTVVTPEGVNVMTIVHDSPDPKLSQVIVQAIIDTHSTTVSQDVVEQADTAAAFYQDQLEAARGALDDEKAALFEYQATLPASAVNDPTFTDARLTELRAATDRAQTDYNALLDRLQQIHLERDAALKGKDIAFQVADPPTVASAAEPVAKTDMLVYPLLGLLLGVSASGVLLFALMRLDDGIRLAAEAEDVAPVLAVVPELGARKKRSWPRHFVRLVVGAAHGAVGNLS